jgi:glycosyltransferase involved in cell wall biosynthesis
MRAMHTMPPDGWREGRNARRIRSDVRREIARSSGGTTPVFLISFNRGAMLERAIAGIRNLSHPTEIVVHDNGSNDEATRAVLDQLERDGIRVVRREAINNAAELENVGDTIRAFFADRPAPSRYVVSDCDIDLSVADARALDLYHELLDRIPWAECVGPMLRISDVPPTYPLFNQVMNRHIEQFWHKRPSWIETSLGRVAYIEALFDTTFAVHRAGEPFRRFKDGLRVYEPYEALHLDWYQPPGETDIYFETSSSQISHWNNAQEHERYRSVALRHSQFIIVRKSEDGYREHEVTLPRSRASERPQS